jgi:hypothetical protein
MCHHPLLAPDGITMMMNEVISVGVRGERGGKSKSTNSQGEDKRLD